MATADTIPSLDTLRERRNLLALGLFWIGGLLMLGVYWAVPEVWTNDALFGLLGGFLAVALSVAFQRAPQVRAILVAIAVLCTVYLVGNAALKSQVSLLSLCFGLVALLSLALGGWVYLTPSQQVRTEDEERRQLLRQRATLGLALLGLTGALALLTIWVASSLGMARFPLTMSLAVLCLIAFSAGVSQFSDPATGGFHERIVSVLHRNHALWTVVLLVLGGLALAGALVQLFRLGLVPATTLWFPETIGLLLAGLVLLGVGLYSTLVPPEQVSLTTSRTLLLIAGGSLGFILTLMTALRAWLWWNADLLRDANAWGTTWWLWLLIYLELLGLALMFGSFYLAQADIRTNAVLRRTLYGYNTVYTGVMLLAMLVLVNIMMYTALPYNFDWLKSRGLYALSDRSRQTLRALKEPVKVYVIMSQRAGISPDVQNLLENCRLYTHLFQFEPVSPETDEYRYNQLLEKYPKLAQARSSFHSESSRGLLVVYGSDSAETKNPPHAFIPQSNLHEQDPRGRFRDFKGEGLLMNEVAFLVAAERKLQIYFSQGNGELFASEEPRILPFFRCGQLTAALRKRNYEIKTLLWGAPGKKALPSDVVATKKEEKDQHTVPKDADVLVMANPEEVLTPEVLGALDRYMDAGGRMIIFTALPVNQNTLMGYDCGLETYLKKYGVEVGRDYLLHLPTQRLPGPRMTEGRLASTNTTEIAAAFLRNRFQLGFIPIAGVFPTRTVKAISTPADPHGGGPKYKAETLLEVPADQEPVWAETDYSHLADLNRYLNRLVLTGGIEQKRSADPLSVGVTITDKDSRPRMVVFGDAAMATDYAAKKNAPYYELFGSCAAWLAGRSTDLGIGPKRSTSYVMKTDDASRYGRMVYLPLVVGVVTLLGLGTGVWLVRRR